MRPKLITLTASNTPYLYPVDYRPRSTTIQATVTGTVSFSVEYTVEPVLSISDPAANANWAAVTDMSAATASVTKALDASITCLKLVHNSGTGSVEIAISQPEL